MALNAHQTDNPVPMINDVKFRDLGLSDYQEVWNDMRTFNENRDESTNDEIWLVEHPRVFTLGLNGKPKHIIDAHDIPVIHSDRGGQVTFHGPGQLVAYILIDLQRRHWGIKKLVNRIEQVIIDLLADYSIQAIRRENAPGVYVDAAKIAALGLRVRRGCTYHGLSLNVDMDLSPFSYINPCGFEGMASTQMKDLNPDVNYSDVKADLKSHLKKQLFSTIQS